MAGFVGFPKGSVAKKTCVFRPILSEFVTLIWVEGRRARTLDKVLYQKKREFFEAEKRNKEGKLGLLENSRVSIKSYFWTVLEV